MIIKLFMLWLILNFSILVFTAQKMKVGSDNLSALLTTIKVGLLGFLIPFVVRLQKNDSNSD